jgi:hypothetical protein
MNRFITIFLLALCFHHSASAQTVVVGVNVINPYQLSTEDQEAMLGKIKSAGVHVIRASITLNEAGIDFAQRAWDQGIRIEWMIYRFGGYDPFGDRPLSAADPEQFRNSFAPILARLEEKGIILAALELGNEINLSGTNPEFTHTLQGRQFGLEDLYHDPEARQVAKGFLQYLKVLAVLKDIRDHSKLNQHTTILTAGLAAWGTKEGLLPKGTKADLVSPNATIEYMRANGLDSLVDAYAIHFYPRGNNPGDSVAAADRRQRLAKFVLNECHSAGSKVGKACWLTEWGFNNQDGTNPANEANRKMLVQEMMGDFRRYVQQGRLAGVLYFSWNTLPPGPEDSNPLSIYRRGALMESGRIAIDASLLK